MTYVVDTCLLVDHLLSVKGATAELVRRAVDRAYGADMSVEEKRRLLRETAGALGDA